MDASVPIKIRERIKIYGIFDRESGKCHYVGQTRWIHKRAEQHFNPFRGKAKLVPNADFRVLRDVLDDEDPKEIEKQMIAAYKEKGEAVLNSDKIPTNYISSAYYHIHWVERDIMFAGFGEAGRALKCTPQTISNHFKSGSLRIDFSEGVTLVLKKWPSYFKPNAKL